MLVLMGAVVFKIWAISSKPFGDAFSGTIFESFFVGQRADRACDAARTFAADVTLDLEEAAKAHANKSRSRFMTSAILAMARCRRWIRTSNMPRCRGQGKWSGHRHFASANNFARNAAVISASSPSHAKSVTAPAPTRAKLSWMWLFPPRG